MKFDPIMLMVVVQVLVVAGIVWVFVKKRARDREHRRLNEEKCRRLLRYVERVHPVLGNYRVRADETWSCQPKGEGLAESFCLYGEGDEPSPEQIDRWQEIQHRLPELLAQIPPPPADDGWGHTPAPFRPSELRPDLVSIRQDLSFSVMVEVPNRGPYMLSPLLEVTTDWQNSAGWTN